MDYSAACNNAMALFAEMVGRQKCLVAEEYVLFAQKVVAASELFVEFSLVPRLELKKVDFPKEYWCFVKKHLVPFVELGWVTPKGREAFVVHKEQFDNDKLREKVARKRGTRCAKQVIIEKRTIVRREEDDAPILERADYVYILVDFPNFSCRKFSNGQNVIRIEDLDWRRFKHALAVYHETAYPTAPSKEKRKVAGATLFVSGEYYAMRRKAFEKAGDAGFTIVATEGKDDVDARLQAALMEIGMIHASGYANMPVISLLSGDKDYRHHLEVLKRHAELTGLSLRLKVSSWGSALSDELRTLATDAPMNIGKILTSICPAALDSQAA